MRIKVKNINNAVTSDGTAQKLTWTQSSSHRAKFWNTQPKHLELHVVV